MATTQSSRTLALEELTIVDADSHLKPDVEDLLPYMDENDAAKQMVRNSNDVLSEVFTHTRASAGQPNDSESVGTTSDPINDTGYEPGGKAQFMDEFGLDYAILTPSGGTGGGAIATINHDPTAVSYARAYNAWMLDEWLDADERFHATALVANQIPDCAAEEIDRMAGEDGVVGVQMPGAGLVPPAGHRSYAPIYEAARDHDLPIVMHSHDAQAAVTFPVQRRWAETYTESHAFSFPAEAMWHVISLVCNGVPERYPDLEFVLQEPGFEWVPWLMWRLDDHYLQNSQDLPMLTKPPSEYIRDQFYFTTQPLGHTRNRQHMGWMMEMAGGGETIVFSTDHPHPDFDTPDEVFQPARTQLDEDDLRGLMGETAIEIFGLD